MNTQDLNKRIAEIKGISHHVFDSDPLGLVWFVSDEKGRTHVIDYITDNSLNHKLVVELLDKGWKAGLSRNFYCWTPPTYRTGKKINILNTANQDFKTATCLAYIEEFGK